MANLTESSTPTWSRRDAWLALVLLLAVLLAYTPVRFAGFIWDDDVVLTGNPVIVGPLGLKEIWTGPAADICPLTLTTFWAAHRLWGTDPLPYHLLGLALHVACALLLWRVLVALAIPGAWLGAALWALHPVQVESVAWISELKNTQSTLFYLMAALFYLRWLRSRHEGSYALTLFCAALAMASKSSTVVLPIVLGLCAWWVQRGWRWSNLARLAPLALMAVIPSALTLRTQNLRGQGPESILFARPWPERAATAGDAIWFYLGKLIWPHPLLITYPRWNVDAASVLSYLPLVASIALLYALWRGRWIWTRTPLFAYAYFLVALAPVLGLIDGFFWRYSLVGDHFQYLASMAPLALAGASLTWLAGVALPRQPMIHSRLAALLLLGLGMLTWHRAWAFENMEAICNDTLAQNPASWLAHNNLGNVYLARGELDAAREQYELALEINPQEVNAHSNLGIILAQQGKPDEAIAQYREALKIRPNFSRAINNLAVTLQSQGRLAEALALYQNAEAINPYFPQVHTNIGNLLLQNGRLAEAQAEFELAVRFDPENASARNQLGMVMMQQGHLREAIAQFEQALRLQPGNADSEKNLAEARAQDRAGVK